MTRDFPGTRWIGVNADASRLCAPFQPGRIALLHTGRVGSELLGSILKSNQRIHWAGEFVNDWVHPLLDPPGDYAGQLVGRLNFPLDVALSNRGWKARRRWQVIKTKRLHFAAAGIDGVGEASQLLETAGFTHRIVLARKNVLRSILSWTRALATRTPHAYRDEEVPTGAFSVPLDAIPTRIGLLPIEAALELREEDTLWADRVAGPHALRLSYEDDLESGFENCVVKVADFLSIKPWKATATTVRTGGMDLRKSVANYDELCERLACSNWKSML